MKLSTLIDKAKRSPLRDLPVAKDATKVPELISAINSALLELCTRLPVQMKILTLAVADGVFEYPLRKAFAQTDPTVGPKYIVDSVAKPFLEDVLSIQAITDEAQLRVPLNIEGDSLSWFAGPDVLRMDYPVAGAVYFVEYRARLPEIDPATEDMDQEVYVPPAMENALLARIEYEVYCGMNMESSSLKAQAALQKFETQVAMIDDKNALSHSTTDARTARFAADGWA